MKALQIVRFSLGRAQRKSLTQRAEKNQTKDNEKKSRLLKIGCVSTY